MQGAHNFFFSELLRSLVQKRKAEELNSALKSKTISKKVRKISSFYQKSTEPEWKRQRVGENSNKPASEANENEDPKAFLNQSEISQDSVINVDKDSDSPPATITQPNSAISHPNTAFYHPYVDPLHFFIDLKVSACDRKNYLNHPIIGKNRVGSAFKVCDETLLK